MESLVGIGAQFHEAMTALYDSATSAGLTLLKLTAAIQFLWIVYDGILNRSLDGFIETFFRAMVTVAIFAGLIRGIPQIVDQVLRFFGSAGGDAERATLNPIALIGTGLTAAKQLIENAGILDAMFLGFVGLLIVLFFVAMAVVVLVALIESYFVGIGAAVTFGLGGLQISRDMAMSGVKTVLGIGMKMFLMGVIVRMVEDPVKDLVESFSANDAYVVSDAFWVIGGAAFGAALIAILPRMAQVMMTGYGGLGVGGGIMSSISFGAGALGKLGSTVAGSIEKGIGAARLIGEAREASRLGFSGSGGSGNGSGGRYAPSSTGIAARAVVQAAAAKLDGTGPRHGSRLWSAGANLARANQAVRKGQEKQLEQRREAAQERRESAAENSRKQTAQSVRAAQQEKRAGQQARKSTNMPYRSNPLQQARQEEQKAIEQRRSDELSRRQSAADASRKQVAQSVRSMQQERRDTLQKDRLAQQKTSRVTRRSPNRNDYESKL